MNKLSWCGVLLALCLSSVARADEDAFVSVEQLEARFDNGVLVAYRIAPRSWDWLRERGVVPVLQVSAVGNQESHFRQRLNAPESVIRVMVPPGRSWARDVTVSIVGEGPQQRIAWMDLGGMRVTRVSLAIQPRAERPPFQPPPNPGPFPPRPPPARGWANNPEVITTCGSVFDGPQNELACLEVAAGFQVNPLPALRACENAMDGDNAELDCFRVASTSRMDVTRMLAACESAMDGDASELACLKETVRARYDMAPVIARCESAMDGDNAELQCISVAADARFDPSQMLDACERGMSGDPEELECFRRSLPR